MRAVPRTLPVFFVIFSLAASPFAEPARGQNQDTKPRFPRLINTQTTEGGVVSAAEVAAAAQVPAGFRLQVFASEPDVQNPIGVTTDQRGRLWVAENYTYAEGRLGFDLRHRDRIVILEDSDGDGRMDQRKVFWDQAAKLTSVEIGFGGVWALCAPQLLFIPDADRDDVPDGPPQVVLDGWNDTVVHHNIVNGLKWGPDGWLYGRHGIQGTSVVGPPGATASQRTPVNCAIWRYHPVRKVFEVVAHGTTNPWGFDYDDHGQMFFINTVIGHLWHVVPGAHYRRMYGADFNPYVYQLIEQTADHFHWDTKEAWNDIRDGVTNTTSQAGGGHAHSGLMIYLGDNWPRQYRNSLFTVNLHGLRINRDRLKRNGSGYVGVHEKDFALFRHEWFRGIDLIYGPDGGVFLADWSDIGECHENTGVHRTSGRIYKLTYKTPATPKNFDLAKKTDEELIQLQLHSNDWYVRQSRRLLHERAAAKQGDLANVHASLMQVYGEQTDATRRLRAMWCLYVTGGATEDWLIAQLDDHEEHVRLWAIRLLVDGNGVSVAAARALAKTSHREDSPLVQLFLASAMQRFGSLQTEHRWRIAEALAEKSLGVDTTFALMLWYGVEPIVLKAPDRAVELAKKSHSPLVRKLIVRRLTSDLENSSRPIEQIVGSLRGQSAPFQLSVLEGMSDALRGWRKAPAPKQWSTISRHLELTAPRDVKNLARELSVVFGDGRALEQFRKLATDGKADPTARRDALRVLVNSRGKTTANLLFELTKDRVLGTDAVRGLASFDHPKTPEVILRSMPRFTSHEREAAVATLSSRAEYARALLAAVRNGTIQRNEINAFHARQIRSLGDASLRKELEEVWGAVRETSQEKRQRMVSLKKSLISKQPESSNLENGRQLFKKTCGNCHVLFGEGGRIGPDLTGSNRKNLDYLLENIVDPSATMAQNFRVSVIELQNGRVITGVIVEKTSANVKVQTEKEVIYLQPKDIASATLQNTSLMPEGLLKPLAENEIRDLMSYLSQGG